MFQSAFVTGLYSGFMLILAIGSQNAFVLRQGLKRLHVLPLVLFCATCDAILIGAGVLGFGSLTGVFPGFPQLMLWLGAAFLFFYGASRFWAAWQGKGEMGQGQTRVTLGQTLALAAAFTWLNPHVYIDTLALMGAISLRFDAFDEKLAFFFGGSLASLVFFSALGFGAQFLSPLLSTPRAWRWLDTLIGLAMWGLAVKLLYDSKSWIA